MVDPERCQRPRGADVLHVGVVTALDKPPAPWYPTARATFNGPLSITDTSSEYDRFADVYQIWTDTAPSTGPNRQFYLDEYSSANQSIVELGVGDGRIAVAAAMQGCSVTGIDKSAVMLEHCRGRAAAAGVQDRLKLIEGDFRDFTLDEPASLIALPYHSIGHLLTLADKRRAIRHIFECLRPGGRFIFDDFLMTPALMAQMRGVQLRAAYQGPSGAERLLWVTSLVDQATQAITVITWEDELDPDGLLARRQYRRLSLSWLAPVQARQLLEDAGFTVEACFGDFSRTPFAEGAAVEQVWIARRPDGGSAGPTGKAAS